MKSYIFRGQPYVGLLPSSNPNHSNKSMGISWSLITNCVQCTHSINTHKEVTAEVFLYEECLWKYYFSQTIYLKRIIYYYRFNISNQQNMVLNLIPSLSSDSLGIMDKYINQPGSHFVYLVL